jgi:CheY-like chemotaxis protein
MGAVVRYRILVVDDERALADVCVLNLLGWGYEAHAAYDGADALLMARRFAPHLIITDVNMPVLDGIELMTQSRSLPEPPEVLLVSGDANNSSRVETEQQKGYRVRLLMKPVPASEMRVEVHAALEFKARNTSSSPISYVSCESD